MAVILWQVLLILYRKNSYFVVGSDEPDSSKIYINKKCYPCDCALYVKPENDSLNLTFSWFNKYNGFYERLVIYDIGLDRLKDELQHKNEVLLENYELKCAFYKYCRKTLDVYQVFYPSAKSMGGLVISTLDIENNCLKGSFEFSVVSEESASIIPNPRFNKITSDFFEVKLGQSLASRLA